ncbi:DUF6417 family protein [Streptomyces sp. NPDC006332]|uniref:DUF6417 family protein n=1 Tax=Streptomyces sp. NPDC006332 TaxID=3155456 RepID=UPI00339FC677
MTPARPSMQELIGRRKRAGFVGRRSEIDLLHANLDIALGDERHSFVQATRFCWRPCLTPAIADRCPELDELAHVDLDDITFAPVEHATERLPLLSPAEAHDLLRLLPAVALDEDSKQRKPVGRRAKSRPASPRVIPNLAPSDAWSGTAGRQRSKRCHVIPAG